MRSTKQTLRPLDAACSCYTCANYSARICDIWIAATKSSAARLGTIHNLHYYLSLMRLMRDAIEQSRFDAFSG